MSGGLLPQTVWRALDANGAAMSGAKLYFYTTGTTTPTDTYTSSSLGTPNANPVVADSGGLFSAIYLDPSVTYRMILKTSGGSTILDVDPVSLNAANIADGSVTAAKLGSTAIADKLGYTAANAATSLQTGKRLIAVPAAAMFPRTSNGCATLATTELSSNKVNYRSLDFDQSTAEYAQFILDMPKSWNEGTVTFRARWTAASSSGNVIWGVQGLALSDDDAMDAAFGTAQTVTDTLLSTSDLHLSVESSAMTIAGSPSAQDRVVFQVYRDAAAGGDTLAADAKLLGIDIYVTLDATTDT